MELQDTAASRISIGFPLGLGLLFACLIFICGFFCFCLHWNKLRFFLFRSSGAIIPHTHIQTELISSQQKPPFPILEMKQSYAKSLPVVMPGDEIPKFIAMECPCQPPKDETITIHIHKSDTTDF